jgi:hypothetical protein
LSVCFSLRRASPGSETSPAWVTVPVRNITILVARR